jgi:hypothetical protein
MRVFEYSRFVCMDPQNSQIITHVEVGTGQNKRYYKMTPDDGAFIFWGKVSDHFRAPQIKQSDARLQEEKEKNMSPEQIRLRRFAKHIVLVLRSKTPDEFCPLWTAVRFTENVDVDKICKRLQVALREGIDSTSVPIVRFGENKVMDQILVDMDTTGDALPSNVYPTQHELVAYGDVGRAFMIRLEPHEDNLDIMHERVQPWSNAIGFFGNQGWRLFKPNSDIEWVKVTLPPLNLRTTALDIYDEMVPFTIQIRWRDSGKSLLQGGIFTFLNHSKHPLSSCKASWLAMASVYGFDIYWADDINTPERDEVVAS